MTHIESGRSRNLNLSQFIVLRFLNYLLYNTYVIHCIFVVSKIIAKESQGTEDNTALLLRIQ